MTRRVRIAPVRPELVVRDPRGRRLPVEGADVELTPYWRRRLASGAEVRLVEESLEAPTPPSRSVVAEDPPTADE